MSKPRPPEVNEEKLSDFIAHADEIDGLKARLLQLEKLRLEGELLPAYIAFEALCSLLGGESKAFRTAICVGRGLRAGATAQ
jgi:hypothetical protein